jgi:hypothetical protein
MEFDLSQQMNLESRGMLEEFFDSAFSPTGQGVRIIKSHIFAHHIDFIKKTWPDCPVIRVHRSDDACLGWWVKCGHFNITYPTYNEYYVDLKRMAKVIAEQNRDILAAWGDQYLLGNNLLLAKTLGIEPPPAEYYQDYKESDIKVTVI